MVCAGIGWLSFFSPASAAAGGGSRKFEDHFFSRNDFLGDMMSQPESGEFQVYIKAAKNIHQVQANDINDAFCKSS